MGLGSHDAHTRFIATPPVLLPEISSLSGQKSGCSPLMRYALRVGYGSGASPAVPPVELPPAELPPVPSPAAPASPDDPAEASVPVPPAPPLPAEVSPAAPDCASADASCGAPALPPRPGDQSSDASSPQETTARSADPAQRAVRVRWGRSIMAVECTSVGVAGNASWSERPLASCLVLAAGVVALILLAACSSKENTVNIHNGAAGSAGAAAELPDCSEAGAAPQSLGSPMVAVGNLASGGTSPTYATAWTRGLVLRWLRQDRCHARRRRAS